MPNIKEHTVKSLLSPLGGGGGAYIFKTHLRGSLIETEYRRRVLFNLAKKMVSVLHKELECKTQVQEFGGHAAEDQKQIRTSSC